MRRTSILALFLLLSASSCRMHERGLDGGECMGPRSTTTWLTNFRQYSSPLGGPQIVQVTYYRGAIPTNSTNGDEQIVLQSANATVMTGWKLQAGDANQLFSLPDTLIGKLSIYSHQPVLAKDFSLNLPSNSWLWNKSGLSTIRLVDNTGAVVDSMQFAH